MSTVTLQHNRIELALHQLRPATREGRPLLLLHGLGECSPSSVPHDVESWPGSIWGLDFTGHGESTIPVGGGYSAEVLLGDVDAAINHLGTVTLVGRGLGGYVALLAAGARVDAVHGAVITDGPGLTGGSYESSVPQSARLANSELAEPINVSALYRPTWLAEVAAAPGVASLPLGDALNLYH
ncbi:MAG: alpha/beta hydrolase [Actinobacteria bacterium]|nr:alpha/beta hydrolase [Actinomycetota bacterium]